MSKGYPPINGLPLETSNRENTAVKVFVQDQTSPVLSVPFLQSRQTVALAADTVVNSNTVTLAGGHGALVGEILEIAETGTNLFYQASILGVAGDVITLDQPINRIYAVSNSLSLLSVRDMLVDGSTSPQVFSILPLPNQAGDMVRVILELRGQAGRLMDFTTFGSSDALAVGCVLRINHGNGTYTNLFNFKSNSDFFEQGFDLEFSAAKATGNTIAGFASRITWGGQTKHGVVIRVDGNNNEALEIVIQDDLRTVTTGNTRFHLIAQGHELQE